MEAVLKTVSVKCIGSQKPIQTRSIEIGTTPLDLLRSIGLDAGYQLSDTSGARIYGNTEDLYSLLPDASMLLCSAVVDAGHAA